MEKLKASIKNEYKKAYDIYNHQKENFMNEINMHIAKEKKISANEFTTQIEQQANQASFQASQDVENLIIGLEEIVDIAGLNNYRQRVNNFYSNHKSKKQQIVKIIQNKINLALQDEAVQKIALSKLGSLGNSSNMEKIESSAILGKIKQLLSMYFRYETVTPSEWTKSNIAGIIYETALANGINKYLSSIGQQDIITAEPVGAKGGIADIKLNVQHLIKNNIIGIDDIPNFEMQVKNYDLEAKTGLGKNISVGSRDVLWKKFLQAKCSKTIVGSANFLGTEKRIIEALGKDTVLYGYAQGKLKFTADLIFEMKKLNYFLSFPRPKSSAYIYWHQF